jgi:hypothetical protein
MKFTTILLIILILSLSMNLEARPVYIKYAYNITGKVSKKLEKRYCMSLCGTGGG